MYRCAAACPAGVSRLQFVRCVRRVAELGSFCAVTIMAAANSTRSWLPEMLDELERRWSPSLSWEEYSAVCDQMTELRMQLRRERGVKNPRMFCHHCNEVHEMIPGPVTIRSVLFALRKIGVLTDKELSQMDSEWRRYRAKHGLDGCGRKRAEPGASPNGGLAGLASDSGTGSGPPSVS